MGLLGDLELDLSLVITGSGLLTNNESGDVVQPEQLAPLRHELELGPGPKLQPESGYRSSGNGIFFKYGMCGISSTAGTHINLSQFVYGVVTGSFAA